MKDLWDERFAQEDYAYGFEPNDFLRESVSHLNPGGKVLCLAEGEGRNAVFLASAGFTVTAVDFSQAGKDKALKLAEKHRVTIQYELADLNDYDMGQDRWDGIVCIFSHTPLPIRKHLLDNIPDALRPGGVFIAEGYNKGQLAYSTGGPKDEDQMFSLEEFQTTFANFDRLHAGNVVRSIIEGQFHTGTASVTQFIARK